MPRVTVLLTCYNHLRFLPQAWESVISQSLQDLQIIAIDDGSTDGTREWLERNAKEHRLIFTERNVGTYAALNLGLEHATGDFIAILNDDDVWMPEKLAMQVELMDRDSNIGLVHTNGGFIDGDGHALPGAPLGFEFPTFETGDILLDLFYQNKIIASAALVRRRCFEELGGFNDGYFGSGDWEMWFRIAEHWRVGFVDRQLTLYRVHGSNASHKLERIWRDDEMLRTWIEERARQMSGPIYDPVRLRHARAHNLACLGTVKRLNGNPAGARAAYAKSISVDPSRWKSYLRWLATWLPSRAFRASIGRPDRPASGS